MAISKDKNTYEGKISRVISNPLATTGGQEDGEETEIAAQITLPADGGWGWVILFCSFLTVSIIDGICFTFGALIDDMRKDFNVPMSLVGLISSIQVSMYFLTSPVAAALINKLGFRACVMSSAIAVSQCLFISYFTKNLEFVCFFYGLCFGVGACILNMSASLSVGFYFEKYRTIALSIAGTGSSFGVMTLFPVNAYLTKLAGWRSTTLFHSGLCGIIYFMGLTYRPLLSLTVTLKEENEKEPTRTVTVLPNLTKPSTTAQGDGQLTVTERALGAVSNVHFPTAAAVVSTPVIANAGPSSASEPSASRLVLRANTPTGTLSRQQLQQVQSKISKYNVQNKLIDKPLPNIDVTNIKIEEPKKRGFLARLFHWEPHVDQARPMYRDDAFYQGRLKDLPEYQKSVLNADGRSKTGLEYQLAVTRAVSVNDLREKRGLFTTAVRRVLASMLDLSLLKKLTFKLLCFNGFLCNLGYLIPLIYLKDKNEKAGMNPVHCSFIMSTVGFMNGFGRLFFGALATKLDPVKMFVICIIVNGASTICSPFMKGVYLQYLYAMIFGSTAGGLFGLRSIVIVKIYGLEKLTNGMGFIMMFLGIGNLLCVPIGGVLESKFGYDVSFYYSGSCVFLSGILLIPLKKMVLMENKKKVTDSISNSTISDQSRPGPASLPHSPPPPPVAPMTTSPGSSTSFPTTSRQHHQQQQISNYRS